MLAPHRKPCDTPQAYEVVAAAPVRDQRWVLPATILGSSVNYIDESVVNVALPAIQRGLGASFAAAQWVFNSYMLALASLMLVGGAAGDRFGRRRVFLIGLAVFALASLACALAPSASWLVGARLVQGTGAALLMPVSLAIVGAAYSGKERGRAIGTWLAAGSIAIAVSRPLGGWLVDAFGWRAVFVLTLPIAATALWLGFKLTPDRPARTAERVDLRGTALAILALGLLCYGLIALGKGDRSAAPFAIAAAFPIFVLFIRTEARTAAPMVPLSLFRSRDFAGANGLTLLYYAGLSGAFFIVPFLQIEVHGYSAVAAGAAFLPLSITMIVGSRWSGGLVERFGARLPLVIGPLVSMVGYAVLGLSGRNPDYWTGFLPGLLVVGIGVTISVAPLTTAVLDAVPDEKEGTASGINNAIDVTGGLVAVAALGLAFVGTDAATSLSGSALLGAYRVVMFAAAVLAALSALTAMLTIRTR